MADGSGTGARDEPARRPTEHAELLSELASHDLALAADTVDTPDSSVSEVERTDAGSTSPSRSRAVGRRREDS